MDVAVPANRQYQLRRCLQKLGLPANVVVDWRLLDQALTHASAMPDCNYEQLELLGDAVLRLAATELLLEKMPEATVGELSAVRSRLVSDQTLAQLGEALGLPAYLVVGSAVKPHDPIYPSLLADALESVLAVLYLARADLSLIRPWLDPHLYRLAEATRQDPAHHDYKTALQQLTQAQYQCLPIYRTTEAPSPASSQNRFLAEVWLQGRSWGQGLGPSKKEAEKAAAKVAFLALQQQLAASEQ